jgi:hypothetical protein
MDSDPKAWQVGGGAWAWQDGVREFVRDGARLV